MTTNAEQIVVVRSLRELDALVAERLMGWNWAVSGYPGEAERGRFLATPDCFSLRLAGRPLYLPASGTESLVLDWFGATPHYTTWGKLEFVIQNREEAGFSLDLIGARNPKDRLGRPAFTEAAARFVPFGCEYDRFAASCHKEIPVAVCLAALASAGCRVRLELGEGHETGRKCDDRASLEKPAQSRGASDRDSRREGKFL